MKHFETVKIEIQDTVAQVTLNRPEVRNAFNPQMVIELATLFQGLSQNPNVRVIILGGAGPTFSAGMDLKWLTTTDQISKVQRVQAAENLLQMYQAIDECPYPVIARVHGAAFGGGAGLIAACDMAVASPDAQFAFREVRLGLIPAIIAPYLLRRLGVSQTTRLCLTGEIFSADVAKQVGLVQEVVPAEELDSHIHLLIEHILQGAPEAIKETKKFLRILLALPDQDKWPLCTRVNAEMRGSAEAAEGLLAFVEKRSPHWVKTSSQVSDSGVKV